MFAMPLVSAVSEEEYAPLLSVTRPVGVGLPLEPLTSTVMVTVCPIKIFGRDGITVTVGVVVPTALVIV
jgi:hypothetical protein